MEWPLCVITSDEKISPPNLALACESIRFSSVFAAGEVHICTFGWWVGILFHSAALLIPLLDGKICSPDVNLNKGHNTYYIIP